jgi:hypothetical protein
LGAKFLVHCRLEQETGVSFVPAHLSLLLFEGKWAEAEEYATGPIHLADCSWMATLIVSRIRVFRVMSKFAAGEASTVSEALFRSADEFLLADPKQHAFSRLLNSMRSDQHKCVSHPNFSLSRYRVSSSSSCCLCF